MLPIKKNISQIILVLITCITIVLVFMCIKNGHNWGDDFSLYIAQAKSIVKSSINNLYVANKFTVQNSSKDFGPN